jgi:hypothetical protein
MELEKTVKHPVLAAKTPHGVYNTQNIDTPE